MLVPLHGVQRKQELPIFIESFKKYYDENFQINFSECLDPPLFKVYEEINKLKPLMNTLNSKLDDEEQAKVREVADISMFRANTGKDIGAYKDAYLHLLEKGDLKKINRLVFANDSVIYPAKYTKELFQKLINANSNMVGYSHVQDIHYHIQSFLFSCDNKLINDKLFVKFWKRYLPVDRRRHMIHKGEVGITKTVLKTGKKITILNEINNKMNIDKMNIDKMNIDKMNMNMNKMKMNASHNYDKYIDKK
jgi:lipopolysaccharide biosynthesis protein